MTTIAESRKLIYERFILQWGGTSLFTFDNEQFDEPEDQPWVRLTVLNILGKQDTLGEIGNRRYNREAYIKAQVFTVVNEGRQKADELTTKIQNIYEGFRISGLYVDNSTINELGTDGKWLMSIVDIHFFYEELK